MLANAASDGKTADQYSVQDFPFKLEYLAPITTPWYLQLLPELLIMAVFIGFTWYLFRQQMGGGGRINNFGKSHANLIDSSKNKTSFADVAGAEEEKDELKEIVDFLKSPKSYLDVGARIPKGVLLVGPPGTGKTLLARAVAGEAGVPFFSISGSDFVELFVGVGASRVRDLFDQAKRNSPSIVFIDEIDAVGRHRGAGLGGGHDEREQTLNQLLVEMDGFTSNQGVIVMAATNRRDILDPALLRPGRFDRQITVNYPDLKGREDIIKVHAKGKPFADDVDFSYIAKRTPFATGAELENIMNEAAILAARSRSAKITQAMLAEAVERVQMGPEKRSHKVLEQEKRMTAYHESGHALVAHYLPLCDEVQLITIVPRGNGAAGYTLVLPEQETDFSTRKQLLQSMAMMLGGHAAEKLVLDDKTNGATSDLQRATQVARSMVTKFGMSDELGTVYLGSDEQVFVGMEFGQTRAYSEDTAALIDEAVSKILKSCYENAMQILSDHRRVLDELATQLAEKETVTRD
ncbi:MAG: ATP-dependent zinc metalloprotease FtsH, partial [Clostridia bacterium]|nr:ATP-dependent zinc metalloprotease FtsH [Clostridia bacterium]